MHNNIHIPHTQTHAHTPTLGPGRSSCLCAHRSLESCRNNLLRKVKVVSQVLNTYSRKEGRKEGEFKILVYCVCGHGSVKTFIHLYGTSVCCGCVQACMYVSVFVCMRVLFLCVCVACVCLAFIGQVPVVVLP